MLRKFILVRISLRQKQWVESTSHSNVLAVEKEVAAR